MQAHKPGLSMKRNLRKTTAAEQLLGPNRGLIGKPRSREHLATPALIVDLDAFEHNLRTLIKLCKAAKMSLRPHAKTHKCSLMAKRQVESGAIGICVANLHEARVLVEAGVPGVHLTTPVVGPAKIDGFVDLIGRSNGLTVVVDDLDNAKSLGRALKREGKTLPVLVDLDIGMHRTGVPTVAGALELVHLIRHSDVFELAGIQAYSGYVQHIKRVSERARVYGKQLNHLEKVLDAMSKMGVTPWIVSGGGTGTFEIDRRAGLFTESQAGSYAVMDVDYGGVQLFSRGGNPYKNALFVQCMVLSNNHPEAVTVDGGYKCFAADGPIPRPARGTPPRAAYEFFGDEFGRIVFAGKHDSLDLGSKVELVAPHCDPTINLHSFLHCVRGNVLVDIWPVDARGSL
jgi:D-serine deaminase-like pyridoxal phosphate-dependent protein